MNLLESFEADADEVVGRASVDDDEDADDAEDKTACASRLSRLSRIFFAIFARKISSRAIFR